jgi:predicted HTH domain antitoxin
MSTLHIPDGVLERAGVTEQEALLELACRLFEIGRLSLFFAAKLAGMSRPGFEDALLDRKIPIYRYDEEDLRQDVETLKEAGI